MDLVLSEEQELLQQTAREFVAGRSSFKRLRALREGDDDGFSRALWQEMGRLGWLGIVLPAARHFDPVQFLFHLMKRIIADLVTRTHGENSLARRLKGAREVEVRSETATTRGKSGRAR